MMRTTMESREQSETRTRFGVFEVDPSSGELRKAGLRVKLQDQPFKVLLALLERPGAVIGREELKQRIWPNESFGDFDHAVNVAVAKLRTALSDSADSPRYVETLHRRGYRFIFPVEPVNGSAANAGVPANLTAANLAEAIGVRAESSEAAARQSWWYSRRVWATGLVLVALALGMGAWWRHRERSTHAVAGSNMQISKVTNRSNVAGASISPDGRYLAYVLRESNGLGLWMREVGTRSDVQVLPAQPGYFQGLTFSPDGRYIFYSRGHSEQHATADLYTLPILGGASRIVAKNVDTPANFSPDGSQFMFVRNDIQRNVAEVRVANADGGGEHLVTTIEQAGGTEQGGGSWSPDGHMLAVSVTLEWGGRHGTRELDVISVADGSKRRLYSSIGTIGRPVWLPGGQEIAVVLGRGGGLRQIWAVPYPSGEPRRITNDLEDYDEYIDLTADGKTIAATAWNATGNVYALPGADFARARQITFGNENLDIILPGPDGRLLVHETGSADGEIWAMKADGSQRVLFSKLRYTLAATRCGSFVILLGENGQLTRTDADGLNPTELVHANGASPRCSDDGRSVYYSDEASRPHRVVRMPVEGGPSVEVAKVPGEGLTGGATVSPDGKLLAIPYHDSGPNPVQRLAIIHVDGGRPLTSFAGVSGYVRWTPDGRALDYFAVRDGIRQIVEQPLAGGAPRLVTKFHYGKVRDFDWSADGKQLYLVHGEINSDAVLITNFR
jgi:Tol biopolymer transport system component/DNA-binding winged helix-turn-helix (wHTH) protein